jgi:hypothetical protein
MSVDAIMKLLRAEPHGYSPDMIRDDELLRVAAFIREDQHDADLFIDRATSTAKGDPKSDGRRRDVDRRKRYGLVARNNNMRNRIGNNAPVTKMHPPAQNPQKALPLSKMHP